MTAGPLYLIDSDVFITAEKRYYSFTLCPGFWASLIHHHGTGRIRSVDRVRNELLVGRETDELVQWVKGSLPREFFLATAEPEVVTAFSEVMLWVQRDGGYFDSATAQFAAGADGWLVAYAHVHGWIVVTNEVSSPGAKRRVPIPDVCKRFGVTCRDTFAMLTDLGVRFEWAGPA